MWHPMLERVLTHRTRSTGMPPTIAEPSNILKVLTLPHQQDQERRHRMFPETAAQQRFVNTWPEAVAPEP
jgi:hypothetical protein